MYQRPFPRMCNRLLGIMLLVSGLAYGQAPGYPEVAFEFHSVVPLGVETFELKPSGHIFNLVASAESRSFEGLRLLGHGKGRLVLTSDGTTLRHYPKQLTFRVSASAQGKSLDDRATPVDGPVDLNQYLLGFRFRLKIYRGLEARDLEPERVDLVGVPADVSYDERVYQLTFNLENVPVDERMVLEVYDSAGDRLTRFHLDLM